jgi:hypothetical protein
MTERRAETGARGRDSRGPRPLLGGWLVPRGRRSARSRVHCRPPHRGKVSLRIEIELCRAAEEVWPEVADLTKFLTNDPFHVRLVVLQPPLKPGGAVRIDHRVFGLRFERRGRLLSFQEGRGYALSDLSVRDPRRGFPHVFIIDLEPLGPGRSLLSFRVKGKWTARWVPPFAARWWLLWVLYEEARLLRRALEAPGKGGRGGGT